jgi:hypothetical protein
VEAEVMTARVTERPIMFSAPMIREILAGRNTETRRFACESDPETKVYKVSGCELYPSSKKRYDGWVRDHARSLLQLPLTCRYGDVGDRLWVRETWAPNDPPSGWVYRATDERREDPRNPTKWKSKRCASSRFTTSPKKAPSRRASENSAVRTLSRKNSSALCRLHSTHTRSRGMRSTAQSTRGKRIRGSSCSNFASTSRDIAHEKTRTQSGNDTHEEATPR